MSKISQINQPISSDLAGERFKELFSDQLSHEHTREYFTKIVKDYVGTVEFMDKVGEYAGREIDKRLFKSIGFWGTIILTTVVTTVVIFFVTKLLTGK